MDPEGEKREETKPRAVHTLPEGFPEEISTRFLTDTLDEGAERVETNLNATTFRVHEQEVALPGGERALLQVDYSKYRSFRESFDHVQFRLVAPEAREDGTRPLIAEMYWYVSDAKDRINYDFALAHRYVTPEHRGAGVGSYLYGIAEAWVTEVAEKAGEQLTLCIVARQKRIMDFAEGLGYSVYGLDAPLRREVLEHPEHFIEKEDEIEGQPEREPFLYRADLAEQDREPWNAEEVWYRKVVGS